MNNDETPTGADETTQKASAGEPDPANKEAARYRRALREVEAERDAAQALLGDARRALLIAQLPKIEVSTDTAIGTLRPEALDDARLDLEDLFDGVTLNEERTREVLTALLVERGYLFSDNRSKHYTAPNEGRGYDVSPPPTFAEAFQPNKVKV